MAARQRSRASTPSRAFYSIIFAFSVLAVISLLSNLRHAASEPGPSTLVKRQELHILAKRDEECRLVHSARDQCAFIKANCPDEEAGLFSYLQLYYCKLPHAKPFAIIILVLWLALLFSTIGIAASDFLCINLSTISTLLGMSESLAGVTFLAFGNGSPDVFSTFAAFNSHSGSLAVGELIGAACFISAVVSGSMAIVRPFKVAKRSFVRDVGFFAIAAGFSMSFLADGRLHLWECIVMVAFYFFYVIFVVGWHWHFKRRRERRLRDAAARSQFHIPSQQELEVNLPDDDEELTGDERERLLGGGSVDDFAALEGANTPAWKMEEPDEDDEQGDRPLAELRNQMRVSRPARGERRNTTTQIRPSLVGALEFRSVLSHLQNSRSHHSIPIGLRQYSDDGSEIDGPAGGSLGPRPSHHRHPSEDILSSRANAVNTATRGRAVSANDAHGLKLDTSVLSSQTRNQISLLGIPSEAHEDEADRASLSYSLQPSQTSIHATGSRDSSPSHTPSPSLLAPPEETFRNPSYSSRPTTAVESPIQSPRAASQQRIPKLVIPSPLGRSSSVTDFPPYTDSPLPLSGPPSIHLPPPSMSPGSVPTSAFQDSLSVDDGLDFRTFKWWPYKYLPPPQTIISALFPTIYYWHGKSIYDKILGLATAPSVFLLTITLPVIETEQPERQPDPDPGLLSPNPASRRSDLHQLPPESTEIISVEHTISKPPGDQSTHSQANAIDSPSSSPKDWNRWLVIVQLFLAPFFVVLIVWANTSADHSILQLLYMTLCSLLFSLIALLILLYFTTPNSPPKYRTLLCFLGFLVSISWIATIANEVVGVLKAFGTIFNISDAILGLTIFACGNSLGDLVADITVARLGFPMMALSACFGGPMLNILLGVGVSGLFMMISRGVHKHEKHPDRPMKYKPYTIDVSTTLVISGVTLLVTLVGLLVVVPLNGWKMDRKIGIGLIVLWSLSTVGNVIVEVLGFGGGGETL